MRKKLPLFFGLLFFIISISPIYLMAYELVSETIITSKYTFKSLEFDEDLEGESLDINTFYLVEGASPYEKIKEVSVAHSFITDENEHEHISVYKELDEAFSDEKNVFYERTYTFSNQKIDLLENLDNSEDVKLLVNEVEIDLADQVKVNRSALLNQRYENLGFVFVEENKEKSERLLIVEFNTVTWNLISIDEAGNIERRQEIREKDLDKDKYLVKVLKESTLGPAYYKSSILMGYPSFYFPVLYPFITVILAIILILYGSFSLKKKKYDRKESCDYSTLYSFILDTIRQSVLGSVKEG